MRSLSDILPGDILVVTDPGTPYAGCRVEAVIVQAAMVLARGSAPGLDGEDVVFLAWLGHDQYALDEEKTAAARSLAQRMREKGK